MKVARFNGSGAVSFEEREDPMAGPGEAVLEVAYCAFCGSDKRLLRLGTSCVPGHEIVGRVIELGDGAHSVSIGQVAAVYIALYCGSCEWCRSGVTNRCSTLAGLVGWQVDGGFAERVRVPECNLLPVPPEIPTRQAVLALDTVGTAAHGLDRAIRAVDAPEGPVLVLGCGPLGLGVVAVARERGLEVVAHDVAPARLATVLSLGARALDADLASWAAAGVEPSVPAVGFSLVVEASGVPAARTAASQLVGQGGAVLLLGEGEQPWSLPASVRWRRTEAAWVRSFYFPLSQAEDNWRLVRKIGGSLEELLVSYEPFCDLPRVSEEFLDGAVTKPVMVMVHD